MVAATGAGTMTSQAHPAAAELKAHHRNAQQQQHQNAGQPPSEWSQKLIAREFVRQYFTTLSTAPENMHRFYSNDSYFCHNSEEPVRGQEVVGSLTMQQPPIKRTFVQTFVLMPQDKKKFYIHNDIFMWCDGGGDGAGGRDSETDERPGSNQSSEPPHPPACLPPPPQPQQQVAAQSPKPVEAQVQPAPMANGSVHGSGGGADDVLEAVPVEELKVETAPQPQRTRQIVASPPPAQAPPVAEKPAPEPVAQQQQQQVPQQPPPAAPVADEQPPQPPAVEKSPAPAPEVVPQPPRQPAVPQSWADRVKLTKNDGQQQPAQAQQAPPPAAAAPTAAPASSEECGAQQQVVNEQPMPPQPQQAPQPAAQQQLASARPPQGMAEGGLPQVHQYHQQGGVPPAAPGHIMAVANRTLFRSNKRGAFVRRLPQVDVREREALQREFEKTIRELGATPLSVDVKARENDSIAWVMFQSPAEADKWFRHFTALPNPPDSRGFPSLITVKLRNKRCELLAVAYDERKGPMGREMGYVPPRGSGGQPMGVQGGPPRPAGGPPFPRGPGGGPVNRPGGPPPPQQQQQQQGPPGGMGQGRGGPPPGRQMAPPAATAAAAAAAPPKQTAS